MVLSTIWLVGFKRTAIRTRQIFPHKEYNQSSNSYRGYRNGIGERDDESRDQTSFAALGARACRVKPGALTGRFPKLDAWERGGDLPDTQANRDVRQSYLYARRLPFPAGAAGRARSDSGFPYRRQ